MRAKMQQVIDGKRYDTEPSTLIASDEYWDGSNYERSGRNTHLYRTKNGRFFVGYSTQWQGERSHLQALTEGEALAMYEQLPEYDLDFAAAFPGRVLEEA